MAEFARMVTMMLCAAAGAAAHAIIVEAASIELIVDRNTGEVSLKNSGPLDFGLIAYSIQSDAGALNSLQWTSIADNYDASGDGSVDADEEWVELSVPGSSVDLSEGVFSAGDGGWIEVGQIVSLGTVWDTTAPMDLVAEVVEPSNEFANVIIDYRSLAADFDHNLVVDRDDFAIWFAAFGMLNGANHSDGDANLDGAVDGRDFLIWQRELEDGVSPASSVALAANAAVLIPEPDAMIGCCVFLPVFLALRQDRRRR